MKTTIKINGLDIEFTDQKPTRPGIYLWGPEDGDLIGPLKIVEDAGILIVNDSWVPLEQYIGLWSAPLVPVTEVKEAWNECYATGQIPSEATGHWKKSRTRRVVEGIE